ncbi:MAG: hypothetical protein M1816_002689 [Peltula sp. TS41687]|nr:MAG: hypothetical protein M1816_002689 [Peltula sp. TS41687]
MSTRHGPKAATVEDYISGEDEADTIVAVPDETAKVAQPKARHKSSRVQEVDLGAYAASDSGYSSHAAATAQPSESKGATTTTTTTTTKSPKLPSSAAPVPPTKRRPTLLPARTYASQPPARPPPDATLAAASRRTAGAASHERCNCTGCQPRRMSVAGPLDSPWNIDYAPFDTRLGPGDPSLSSASRARYEQEMTARANSRPPLVKTYSSRPARPVSYHEGVGYSSTFMARAPAASPDTRYPVAGPSLPVSPMTYSAPQGYSLTPSLPPPRPPPYPVPLPYVESRPAPPRWMTDQQPVRPVAMYGPLVVDYGGVGHPVAAPVMHRRPSNNEHSSRRTRLQDEEDYFRMPPPPPPVPAGHPLRPGVRHQDDSGGFTREHLRPRSKSRTDEGRDYVPDGWSRGKIHRNQSEHLPRKRSLKNEKKPDLRNDESLRAETERRRRRSSYYDHEGIRASDHVLREHRASDLRTPAGNLEVPAGRGSGASSRPGSDSGSQNRNNHNSSGSRDGGEAKSRPLSGIAVSVPDSDDNFTMKFASGAGVKFDFTGGLEGRTVSLRPGQDGEQAELSIGSRKGSAYLEGASAAQLEYARSGRRRELEDGEGAGQSRSSTRSRRSSRVRAPSRNPPMF